MSISTVLRKMIGEKKRWRQYKARTRALPPSYRAAVEAIERYLMYFGAADGEQAAAMFEDLADLFERAAADGTPIRSIVGEDPVEFVETFRDNYFKGGWITRERERLLNGIASAESRPEGTR